tara:strand:- start:285422 stop:286054 length:633 start_codon:yes stop_codon:yes gene_type:complete
MNCPQDAAYFCRPSEVSINPHIKSEDFHRIPATIVSLFSKQLESKNLQLDLRWESPYFGAGVSIKDQRINLLIFGGTTRIEGMTKGAYAALVCHEIGHILGGSPYQDFSGAEMFSREGQADFFAASVCLPKFFSHLGVAANKINDQVESAGWHMFKSMMPFSTSTSEQPLIRERINLRPVSTTLRSYPSLQCRYETFRDPSKKSSCWFAH